MYDLNLRSTDGSHKFNRTVVPHLRQGLGDVKDGLKTEQVAVLSAKKQNGREPTGVMTSRSFTMPVYFGLELGLILS